MKRSYLHTNGFFKEKKERKKKGKKGSIAHFLKSHRDGSAAEVAAADHAKTTLNLSTLEHCRVLVGIRIDHEEAAQLLESFALNSSSLTGKGNGASINKTAYLDGVAIHIRHANPTVTRVTPQVHRIQLDRNRVVCKKW